MFYLFFNKITKEYYCGRSKKPERSIASHINRAFNSQSKRYNTPLHTALRKYGLNNFTYYVLSEPPDWIKKFNQYTI